jgi:CheY-like chemotaxis protein
VVPKCILIVEDDEVSAALLTDIVEVVLGQDALLAVDGHEAVKMAHQHRPDIILMDLDLPKMDGWTATRSLKSTTQFQDTPILAITAHAMTGDRERALEAGCDDYFQKPIDLDEFVAFLQPYLANHVSGRIR